MATEGRPKRRDRRTLRYERLQGMLSAAREAAGLTQVQLAQKLGRPQSYVSKYESGECRLDVVEFLEVVAALGCDAAPMLTEIQAVEDG